MDLELGSIDLRWSGWRLKGRHLLAPDGTAITPERLQGIVWRDEMELRRAGYASRKRAEAGRRSPQYGPGVKVVIFELAELRVDGDAAG